MPTLPTPAVHVLIIHRSDETQQYAEYLRTEGFHATEASDTDEGVAKALALKPNFIVLDSDLDGETTARLKAHALTAGIPVIALAKMEAVLKARGAVVQEMAAKGAAKTG
jgi:DNA-binding response OmpR family regulator